MLGSQGLSQSSVFDLERFQELLQQTRDIPSLWDYPLLEFLENLHSNIATLDFGEEFNPDMLNFSQAGLIIQGSTNVLAKKVKNLYDLVTSSSKLGEDEEVEKSGTTKRKKKIVEWVIDDKLAPIEDPEPCDNLLLDDEPPRLEITTMPKIPFCLLHSLDSQSHSDKASYRINNIPDQKHCVIILDSSQTFDDFEEPEILEAPSPQQPIVEQTQEDEVPLGGDFSDAEPQEDETPFNPPELPTEVIEERKETPSKRLLLDPDATNLTFAVRPFKKLIKPHIPTTFVDGKESSLKKQSLKKPFHTDIFFEPFSKLKKARKRRMKEEDRQAVVELPLETGREHILDDLETYVEETNMDFDTVEDDYVPPEPSLEYSEICRNFIASMIEEGQKQVMASSTAAALSNWEKKLTPVLENEQKRKPFDIVETSQWITDCLSMHPKGMTFSSLTEGLQPHEISRVFLSVLVMTNTCEVSINKEGFSDDDFLVELLKTPPNRIEEPKD